MRTLMAGVALAGALVAAGMVDRPAWAQQDDVRQLQDQIQLLRREMADMQRVLYKGEEPPKTPGLGASQAETDGHKLTARLQVKYQELSDQLRSLTGQYEQLDNRMRRIEKRMDKLVSDIDFRLRMLEDAQAGRGGNVTQDQTGASPGQMSAPQPRSTQSDDALVEGTTIISSQGTQGPASGAPTQGESRGDGVLGQISQQDLAAAGQGQENAAPSQDGSAAQTRQQAATQPQKLGPAATPKEEYDYAMTLLHQHDFAAAEEALRSFMEQHSDHELAGNAMYWLGETYYARQRFEDAASVFSDAYMRDKKAVKATHSLLKLAMSLSRIEKNEAACVAYRELLTKHKDTEPRILDRARQGQKALDCP